MAQQTIADRIHKAMELRGIATLRKLARHVAEQAGEHAPSYGALHTYTHPRKPTEPPLRALRAIALGLDVDFTWLATGTGGPEGPVSAPAVRWRSPVTATRPRGREDEERLRHVIEPNLHPRTSSRSIPRTVIPVLVDDVFRPLWIREWQAGTPPDDRDLAERIATAVTSPLVQLGIDPDVLSDQEWEAHARSMAAALAAVAARFVVRPRESSRTPKRTSRAKRR